MTTHLHSYPFLPKNTDTRSAQSERDDNNSMVVAADLIIFVDDQETVQQMTNSEDDEGDTLQGTYTKFEKELT